MINIGESMHGVEPEGKQLPSRPNRNWQESKDTLYKKGIRDIKHRGGLVGGKESGRRGRRGERWTGREALSRMHSIYDTQKDTYRERTTGGMERRTGRYAAVLRMHLQPEYP